MLRDEPAVDGHEPAERPGTGGQPLADTQPDDRTALVAVALLEAVAEEVARRYRARVAHLGLSGAHLDLVALLAAHPRWSTDELGHRMALGTARFNRLLLELETAGVVNRPAHPLDRRRRLLTLTPSGLQLARRLARYRRDQADELCGGLSGPERRQLVDLLGGLLRPQR